MTKATLVGYHGKRNFGDDMFFRFAKDWLNKRLVREIAVVSPGDNICIDMGEDIDIWKVKNPLPSINRLEWFLVLKESIRSKYLIFAAGSILTIQPFIIMYLVLRVLKSINPGIKIFAFGVSIGPFRNGIDEFFCKRALLLMDKVILREEYRGFPLDNSLVSYDIAVPVIDRLLVDNSEKKQKSIGLCVTSRGFGVCDKIQVDNDFCSILSGAIKSVLNANSNLNLKLLCICNDEIDGDVRLTNALRTRLSSHEDRIDIVYYDQNYPRDLLREIKSCSAIIAYRLHCGVASLLAEVPLLQIAYSEKTHGFFESNGLDEKFLIDSKGLTESVVRRFCEMALLGELDAMSRQQKDSLLINSKKTIVLYDGLDK